MNTQSQEIETLDKCFEGDISIQDIIVHHFTSALRRRGENVDCSDLSMCILSDVAATNNMFRDVLEAFPEPCWRIAPLSHMEEKSIVSLSQIQIAHEILFHVFYLFFSVSLPGNRSVGRRGAFSLRRRRGSRPGEGGEQYGAEGSIFHPSPA